MVPRFFPLPVNHSLFATLFHYIYYSIEKIYPVNNY